MRFACLRQEFEIRNVEFEMVCLPAAGLRKARGEKWEAETWGSNSKKGRNIEHSTLNIEWGKEIRHGLLTWRGTRFWRWLKVKAESGFRNGERGLRENAEIGV